MCCQQSHPSGIDTWYSINNNNNSYSYIFTYYSEIRLLRQFKIELGKTFCYSVISDKPRPPCALIFWTSHHSWQLSTVFPPLKYPDWLGFSHGLLWVRFVRYGAAHSPQCHGWHYTFIPPLTCLHCVTLSCGHLPFVPCLAAFCLLLCVTLLLSTDCAC